MISIRKSDINIILSQWFFQTLSLSPVQNGIQGPALSCLISSAHFNLEASVSQHFFTIPPLEIFEEYSLLLWQNPRQAEFHCCLMIRVSLCPYGKNATEVICVLLGISGCTCCQFIPMLMIITLMTGLKCCTLYLSSKIHICLLCPQ